MSEPESVESVAPKYFVQFREHEPVKLPNGKMSQPPKKIEIVNGDYRRTFEAAAQPFAVQSEDELQLLKNSGFFVAVEHAASGAPAGGAKTARRKNMSEQPDGEIVKQEVN